MCFVAFEMNRHHPTELLESFVDVPNANPVTREASARAWWGQRATSHLSLALFACRLSFSRSTLISGGSSSSAELASTSWLMSNKGFVLFAILRLTIGSGTSSSLCRVCHRCWWCWASTSPMTTSCSSSPLAGAVRNRSGPELQWASCRRWCDPLLRTSDLAAES